MLQNEADPPLSSAAEVAAEGTSVTPVSPTQRTRPILEIAGLYKRFGDFTALDSVDLTVEDGEFLTIVGPSGCGKTTLIRLLVGMDEATDGTIWLRNQRIDQTPANKRPTCMVFQSLALFPHRTVGQNIEFPLKIRGIRQADRRARALELLELLRLPRDYYGKRIQQCSGGERQRVALARALAFDPEILFFDEPLSALDFRLRKTLEKELKDLHARTGKTFVYITHSLEEAMVMSDRIAIMRAGRFEQIGRAEDIYNRPVNRFVAEFMGEVNLFAIEAAGDGLQAAQVVIDPTAVRNLKVPPSGRGWLMVRPEAVRFLEDGEPADAAVHGLVRSEYNLGSRMQYAIDLPDGTSMTVETLGEAVASRAPGATARLGWSLDRCHVIAEA